MYRAIFSLVLLPLFVGATEFAPWFGRYGEIELRTTAFFQFYPYIATPIHPNCYSSFDQFCNLSVVSSVDTVSAEAELSFANTRHRSFGFDCVRLTGRYLLMNDIIGDWLSLTAGVTLIGAGYQALRDLSSFHHGTLELETHIAFGKEVSSHCYWVQRWWGFFAYGVANKGKPWLRGDLTWEKNLCDLQQIQVSVHSLWGIGNRNIFDFKHFPGYGPFRHRSVELGFRYTFILKRLDGRFSLEYARRLYAQNFPAAANRVMLRLYFPFGL